VEKLAMAAQKGTITLALRSPDDASVEETQGCTLDEALGRQSVADDVSDGELVLNRELSEPSARKHAGPYWSMIIQSPGAAHQFKWATQGAVPQMETLYSSDSSSDDSTEDEEESGKDGDEDLGELDDLVADG
jgi:hypothetical protein